MCEGEVVVNVVTGVKYLREVCIEVEIKTMCRRWKA